MLQALPIYFQTYQRCPKATSSWVLGCSQQLRSTEHIQCTCCCYVLLLLLLCCCIDMCCCPCCVFLCCCCCPVAPLSLSCLQLDPKSIAATYKRVRIFGEGATGAHTLRVELWGCGVLQRKMLKPQTPPPRPPRFSTSARRYEGA